MSYISTIYDQMVTVTAALLPSTSGYKRIPSPYNLEGNTDLFLKKGYGLIYGGSSQEEGEFCNFAIRHVFTIILTRLVRKLDSNTTKVDDAAKLLLEDVYKLQNDLYNVDKTGLTDEIRQIDLGTVSPISNFITNKENFKSVEVNFEIVSAETIT